jgi:4-oxalocrotonate tautomerase
MLTFSSINFSRKVLLSMGLSCSGVNMPLVEIKWWKGRDDAAKAKTIELVTQALCDACGCSPEAVTVIIQDIDKAAWGRGGKPSG